jgi:hypothetical protein
VKQSEELILYEYVLTSSVSCSGLTEWKQSPDASLPQIGAQADHVIHKNCGGGGGKSATPHARKHAT